MLQSKCRVKVGRRTKWDNVKRWTSYVNFPSSWTTGQTCSKAHSPTSIRPTGRSLHTIINCCVAIWCIQHCDLRTGGFDSVRHHTHTRSYLMDTRFLGWSWSRYGTGYTSTDKIGLSGGQAMYEVTILDTNSTEKVTIASNVWMLRLYVA